MEEKGPVNISDLPFKLLNYANVFNLTKAAILPYY